MENIEIYMECISKLITDFKKLGILTKLDNYIIIKINDEYYLKRYK